MLKARFHEHYFFTNLLFEGIQFWTERLLMNQKKKKKYWRVHRFVLDPVANGRENWGTTDF